MNQQDILQTWNKYKVPFFILITVLFFYVVKSCERKRIKSQIQTTIQQDETKVKFKKIDSLSSIRNDSLKSLPDSSKQKYLNQRYNGF